ncbi:MAG TPA: MaoC family dehydratase N-terminal domain-containing protein [Streptosporangiaceae bacterium]|nr:MaoC family dehydratase N-terminal domain-containing protein [Streptosporangiaceae bacterium]
MAFDEAKARAYGFEPVTVTVDRGRLAFFARATGQADPVYTDLAAARAAGHRDLPVPPTFFFGLELELELPDPFGYLAALGVDLRHMLHGKQSFTYHALVYAGETVTLRSRITGVTVRSGGAMVLLVKTTDITRDGEPVAEASSTIIVRDPEAKQ